MMQKQSINYSQDSLWNLKSYIASSRNRNWQINMTLCLGAEFRGTTLALQSTEPDTVRQNHDFGWNCAWFFKIWTWPMSVLSWIGSYLDLLLSIGRDGQLRTSLYDKRDDFNFHITNFPFLSSNIPSSPAYGVFISQLIRYARACSSYECFILRAMRLSNKLLGQGYVKERLKSSLRKFYGRYGDLTKQYEVPLSRMLHDILDDDHIQWHPPLIGHYTDFWHLLIWTSLPNLTFYLIVQGFHGTYATGAACQQGTLTPPDTWSCPTLGLACVLMSRPISPELVLSPDFWNSNTPRYFSFAL